MASVELAVKAPVTMTELRDNVGAHQVQTTLADKMVSPDTMSDSTVPTILTVSVEAPPKVTLPLMVKPFQNCDGDRNRRLVTQVHIAAEVGRSHDSKGVRSSKDACNATR